MRLRRSVLTKPGIARKRRGKGFAYYRPDGKRLSDPETLQRIKDLVIPPAWKNVWISPYSNGHIQAVGVDAAGRKQYLYHSAWQEERAEEKFDRVLELSTRLPAWRAEIARDLTRKGLTRKRVLCARAATARSRLLSRRRRAIRRGTRVLWSVHPAV